jgi:hypothetical protein
MPPCEHLRNAPHDARSRVQNSDRVEGQCPACHARWEWHRRSRPEELWRRVADTNRCNRDTGVPAVEEIPASTSPLPNARPRRPAPCCRRAPYDASYAGQRARLATCLPLTRVIVTWCGGHVLPFPATCFVSCCDGPRELVLPGHQFRRVGGEASTRGPVGVAGGIKGASVACWMHIPAD